MPPTGKKRSRPRPSAAVTRLSCLVQTSITEEMKDELTRRANSELISEAAYIRRVLMKDLGFSDTDKSHA